MYKNGLKRVLDFTLSLLALIVFLWLLLIIAILVKVFLGGPVIFSQPRPGKDEKIFNLYKFRTMTNQKDEEGNLLPDAERLTRFGKILRASSMDELPELINILKGDMSIVGPRPQLVRDMTFMTDEQRRRHQVRPGLTGLAQVMGRNNITWEQKFEYDLEYIDRGITLIGDVKIVFFTVWKVLKQSDTVREGTASDMDFGDWLISSGRIDKETYEKKQAQAKELLATSGR